MSELSRPDLRRRSFARKLTGISYEHPVAFYLGVLTVTVGVVLQLPMYYMGRHDHYHLAGMPVTPEMAIGMALMLLGMGLTIYSLFPRQRRGTGEVANIRVRALDDAPIKASHVALLLVMAAAITIDVMKPVTLAFIAPGAAQEYGLKGPLNPGADALPIALYPLAGISGTVVGSFTWGWLADRIGRRASMLVAAVLFIAVSTCGAMPAYWINLLTCFIMGLGVGGMLPITFALLSETIPARHRGWLMVLIGGDIVGAYIIMSWLASTIGTPERFGWRMLWLIGIPLGLFLVMLNRWIPESPRFLLQQGREEEARAVMHRYGAKIVEEKSELTVESDVKDRFTQLFANRFVGITVVVVMLALGIGIVQYGFQQWMPSNLQRLGFSSGEASRILRDAALLGFPFTLPVALLYGFWSSKKTIILMASVTAAALAVFVVAGDRVVENSLLLHAVLIIPIWGISLLNSVLAAYTVEIYPTRIRARGSGLSAGATKFGGVLILAMVVAALAAPSIRVTALVGAIPIVIAVIAITMFGPETRRRRLEQITAEELHLAPATAAP